MAAAPSFVMLALFYSLALHLYLRYGGWSITAGEHGVPVILLAHAAFAGYVYIGASLMTAFGLPAAALVCIFVPRWRPAVLYIGLSIALFLLSVQLMKLAPQPFLRLLGWPT